MVADSVGIIFSSVLCFIIKCFVISDSCIYSLRYFTFQYFFLKYTATHEQVTRSAPSREPNDAKRPYVNTR